MLMTAQQRQALKNKNKIASLDGGILYDQTLMRQERAEGWFRPFVTFEKVPLKNGPKVENVAYGTYMGGESQMYDLGHGWDGMWGAYVGYNGSHQNYDGVSIYQNGGTLGVLGMAYKGNFFTGLTINAGASGVEASTMYGNDSFTMLIAGTAAKTGYNWELADGKFIIQPSLQLSYSFVNTFDYTNSAGVRIDSDPLNAITIEPGIKFIGNLRKGWQPYAGVSVIINAMDKANFNANNVSLPSLSVNPYVKYSVGLRKTWGERFTGFFQTFITNGGRNGVGLQLGFRWAIGK
jgi:outer membrane autotransporter protein